MATILSGVTLGVVQAIKQASKINTKLLPLVAILVGMILGSLAIFLDADLAMRMWAGGISGLAAVGLFEGIDNIKKERD